MKQLTLLLSMLLFAGISHAQTGPKTTKSTAKSAAKSSHDHCTMKDGKMMMMKGGKMMPMTTNMTMSDGSMCMTDGTCKMKDGTVMKMKEGQCMMMNGKMTMHPGSTKRPMMKGKADDKMGDMKM